MSSGNGKRKHEAKITPAALSAIGKGDFENAVVAMTPGGIEAQEKRGQEEFVANETLPIDGTKNKREVWEGMGFKLGRPVDDLFIEAQFPPGWKKVATSHSMWSHLIDDKGRKRASIFYKAAFYDRSAKVHLNTRFSYGTNYDVQEPYPVVVRDGDKILHVIGVPKKGNYEEQDKMMEQAKKWLEEKYPNWEDSTVYWD